MISYKRIYVRYNFIIISKNKVNNKTLKSLGKVLDWYSHNIEYKILTSKNINI